MIIAEDCEWYQAGLCEADHCEDCLSWYDYYRKQEGCSPT